MSDVLALFRIQKLELEIIDRTKRIKAINAQLEDDAALQAAQAVVDAAREAYENAAKQANELGTQIASVSDKRSESEARLYSGINNNPRELADMNREVEALARRKSSLEDELRRLAADRDTLLQRAEEAEAELAELQEQQQQENQALIGDRDALSGEVRAMLAQRKEGIQEIPPELFQRYNSMRSAKSNRPVAELRDGACTICGIEQNSSVLSAMYRTDAIVTCQNCGRILIRL